MPNKPPNKTLNKPRTKPRTNLAKNNTLIFGEVTKTFMPNCFSWLDLGHLAHAKFQDHVHRFLVVRGHTFKTSTKNDQTCNLPLSIRKKSNKYFV